MVEWKNNVRLPAMGVVEIIIRRKSWLNFCYQFTRDAFLSASYSSHTAHERRTA